MKLFRLVTFPIPSLSLLLLLLVVILSPVNAGAFSGVSTRRNSSPIKVDVDVSTVHMFNHHQKWSIGTKRTMLSLRGGQQTDEDDTVMTTDESVRQESYGSIDEVEVEMIESQQVDDSSITSSGSSISPSSPMTMIVTPIATVLRTATSFYSQQLKTSPILTKSLTAGIIFGLSDWCAQLIENGGSSDDDTDKSVTTKNIVYSRIVMTFLVGLLFFGPAANAWYSMIFKVLPSTSLISTLKKAILGQIFFGPTFTCVFFAAGMIQSGTFSLKAWLDKIRNDLPPVWLSGIGYWPIVDFISYKVVPMQWIPLFVNFASFVWTIYLSLISNKSKA